MSTVRYWPVRVETRDAVVEVLVEAKADRKTTLGWLEAAFTAEPIPGGLLVITIGAATVEAPAGTPGQVEQLADLVARS